MQLRYGGSPTTTITIKMPTIKNNKKVFRVFFFEYFTYYKCRCVRVCGECFPLLLAANNCSDGAASQNACNYHIKCNKKRIWALPRNHADKQVANK